MRGRMGEHHYRMERAESAKQKAWRIVREELALAHWKEGTRVCAPEEIR